MPGCTGYKLSAMIQEFNFKAIATLYSPFAEKFAVPRQPGLVTAARAELHFASGCNREEIIRGLEGFSHLWLIFVFHQVIDEGWTPTVRPPRLGGNRRVGVFATRSPFRPNPIGLSVVKLEGIEKRNKQWLLHLSGVDLMNGTPIVDIKPYVPYVDAIATASGGFTEQIEPNPIPVNFNEKASLELEYFVNEYPGLEMLIRQVIAQQPQPGYLRNGVSRRSYGMRLYDLNIRWLTAQQGCEVTAIEKVVSAAEEET